VWAATPAPAQVQIDTRLEKSQYVAGEPIVVTADVRNVGDESLMYSDCANNVRLEVVGANRRVPPNLFGCSAGATSVVMCGASSHPPLLAPGQTTSVTYLLKEYDLSPGQYRLIVSGRFGTHWQSVSAPPTVPARASHAPTEPVPGAQFEHALSLNVVAGNGNDLVRVFAPFVSDADAADPARRHNARAAIIEGAVPFLEPLIERFAEEGQLDVSAIEALGRLGTAESRAELRKLFNNSESRSAATLALARVGHEDDATFFSRTLESTDVDLASRGSAALGLGHVGGERAVQYLERALPGASSELRSVIATALGNTRSRLAVPVLIRMFGNNPAQAQVISALETLTHRPWGSDSYHDPAAQRRRWLKSWRESGSNSPLYGPDECPSESAAPAPASAPPVRALVPPSRKPRAPKVTSLRPTVAARNSMVALSGYWLGIEETNSRVALTRGSVRHEARILAAGGSVVDDHVLHFVEVAIPSEVTPGRWEIAVETSAGRSTPVILEITEPTEAVITGISPAKAHPAQLLFVATKRPPSVDSTIELTDASHAQWRIPAGHSPRDVTFTIPDDVAEGEAIVRVRQNDNAMERISAPFTIVVTAAPLPLDAQAIAQMKPVAPGQWTDLGTNDEIDWEIQRVDRVEVEFRQRDVAVVKQATGIHGRHLEVPTELAPGQVLVRTRTWIEQTASEWSPSTPFLVLQQKVPPFIEWIDAGPDRTIVWRSGSRASKVATVERGAALILFGDFPVASAADLRVRLRGKRQTYEIGATNGETGIQVELPRAIAPGDWRLVVDTKDGSTSPVEIKIQIS